MNRLLTRHSLTVLAASALLVLAACSRNDPSTYMESAKTFATKGDYKSAIIQLKNAIQGAPDNAEVRFLLAKALLETQDAVGAETEARKAIDLKYDPDVAYPLLARALVAQAKYEQLAKELGAIKLQTTQGRADLGTSVALATAALGNRKAALDTIDGVLREVPTDVGALIAKAQLVVQDGRMAEAGELLQKALAAAPTDPNALFAMAQLQIAQGERVAAAAALEKLVQAQPDSRPAKMALISVYVAAPNLPAAQTQLDSLKKLAPGEVGTVYSEALVAMAKGDAPRAKQYIQQVLSVAPDHLQTLYLSGLIDLELGAYSSAEEALRKVVARMPGDVATRKLLATSQLRSGQALAALDTLDPVLRRGTEDANVYRLAAEANLAAGNVARGGELYERASKYDAGDVRSKVRLAQVRLATGDTERAFKDLEALSQSDTTQYQSDLTLIAAHMQRREFDKALAAVAELEKKQPDNSVTRNLRGAVYMAKRDYKNARIAFEKSLEAKPGNVPAAYYLALIDVQEGKAEDARKRYEAMIVKDPKNEQLLLALAQVTALSRENQEEAKAIIEKAIAANPGSARPRVALVAFYARINDNRAALSAAQAAQTSFPDDPLVLEALGSAQLAAGENNQAVATMARIAQLQPGSALALVRLGSVQFGGKDYPGAIESARKALALQPDFPQAWGVLIKSQIASGQMDAAIADARKLQKEQSNRALGFAMEGEILSSQKKWNEAAVVFADALKRQPMPLLAAATYAALTNAGKTSEAKTLADRWSREHPDDTTVAELIAERAMVRKEYVAAIAHYRAILAVNAENTVALNNLAWMLSEAGDPKAREYAERAYQLAPFNASVVDTLGWTLFKTGDTVRGTQMLRLASNLAPNQADIRLHYAQALVKSGDKDAAKRVLATLLSQPPGSLSRVEAEKIVGTK